MTLVEGTRRKITLDLLLVNVEGRRGKNGRSAITGDEAEVV